MVNEPIEINIGTANVRIQPRPLPRSYYDGRRWYMGTTWKEYESFPRVYVSTDEAFNMAEDFINRTRRPYNEWRQPTKDALAAVGIAFEKMNWSKHAGCSMCPCSPGFILRGVNYGPLPQGRFDVWVTLKGAPAVDEAQPIDPARIEALERL
jgi:hypothetical protein